MAILCEDTLMGGGVRDAVSDPFFDFIEAVGKRYAEFCTL